MNELIYKAELLDDVILSQRTSTAGDHKSLDYIPGSAVLGSVAALLYSRFPKDGSWTCFHTSKVCFNNAYPLVSGRRSIPMPLSFHAEKVPSEGHENSVLNFLYDDKKDGKIQYRQQRSGYVSISGKSMKVYSPSKTSRRRTAIDIEKGSAAQSQLYGYESLNAGQVFVGKFRWDDSVSDSDELRQILRIFREGEILHIGRSRTASYGRVRVSEMKCDSSLVSEPKGTKLSILAVSDLVLADSRTGRASLVLSAEHLGLDDSWRLDGKHTFIRPNIVYSYNSYRHELETQKSLVSKGSVFTFESDKELGEDEISKLKERISDGVGRNRGQGFGEIAILSVESELEKERFVPEKATAPEMTKDEAKWVRWIVSFCEDSDVKKRVDKAVETFISYCREIKALYSFDDDSDFIPRKSQWGRVREVLANYSKKEEIQYRLFDAEDAVVKGKSISYTEKNKDTKVKNSDPEWNYSTSDNRTLRDWLMDFIESSSPKNTKNELAELLKRCQDLAADRVWLREKSR